VNKLTKFIAVVSGKGGAGKTTTAINLGYALNKLGKKVIILDANFATPNLASHLGLTSPQATLNDFLKKKKSLHEITHLHHSGLTFIPSSISYQDFKKAQPDKLAEIFEHLENMAEFVIVDSPAGLGYELVQILKNTDEAIIVTNPHLSSVIDSLKTIELVHEHHNAIPGFVLNLSNKGKKELKPREIENTLEIPLIANIPSDKRIRKALYKQTPSIHLYPRSTSSKQYFKLAEHILHETL